MPLTISAVTHRRYCLGQQGLWPGRRWSGAAGTRVALEAIHRVQVDPLQVLARSHDLALWGRVADYQPEHLDALLYQQRAFFDWGGVVMIRPMHTLPYWRVAMERKAAEPRQQAFVAEHGATLDAVLDAVRERGPLASRDLSGKRIQGAGSFRSSKVTSKALYHLWLAGELMTHHRRGFERVYDLREHIAPALTKQRPISRAMPLPAPVW